ncbi:GNAT family N-acetyltransferase [Promicromonospora soli]|uniref:GNAT family N-acetyltransferase n=1 Tax=Promicromonospora soli TaxID=2035533 RepID=UPI00167BC4E5|nr:GNAT family N-acetyltransferase [Promicromonospora soli]
MGIIDFRPRQSKEAAAVAAVAFAEDPIWGHTLTDARRRRLPHTILLRAQLRTTQPSHTIRVAKHGGRIIGLAFWNVDGATKPHESAAATDPRVLRAARTMMRRAGRDRHTLATMCTALAESYPCDNGWFLGTLVVHPDHQGTGVGSALLRDGLARADTNGQPVSLQTSTAKNVRFYERHGFEVTEMVDEIYPGAPPLWTMRRPAAAVGHQA